jgi:hypothetical protein
MMLFRSIGLAAIIGFVFGSCTAPAVEAPAPAASEKPPIFNAHMHAAFVGMDDAAYLRDVLAEMDENGISQSVLFINEPSDIAAWGGAAPGRFLLGAGFPCVAMRNEGEKSCSWDGADWPDIDWLRAQYESGVMRVMGELAYIYAGVAPTDPRMEPYWALAAELEIPVGVHINRGPPADSPSRPAGCCPNFDPDLGDPSLLRPVLENHPTLKIWLQHAGFPAMPMFDDIDYLEETFALLADDPNVYVDMTALHSVAPPPVHEAAVRAFLERGFIDRVMFATDNWEAAPIIERYEAMDFLTDAQKRGIFHDNAARFFALAG